MTPGPAAFDGRAPRLPSGSLLPELIAVDLDGTLLGTDKRVSARTRAALDAVRALGVRVVIATGRPLRTALPIAEQVAAADTVVAYNGAAMWHAGGLRVVRELDLEATRAALVRLRAAASGVILGLETASGWYLDGAAGTPVAESADVMVGNAAHLLKGGMPTAIGPLEEYLTGGRIKLLAASDDLRPRELATSLEGLDLYTTWSLPFLLEVHHREVNKGAALAVLCQELGIESSAVAAFGDQHNDSAMLAWAGLGVAMGNAEAEALAAADLVTTANDADGVAEVIESWLSAAGASRVQDGSADGTEVVA